MSVSGEALCRCRAAKETTAIVEIRGHCAVPVAVCGCRGKRKRSRIASMKTAIPQFLIVVLILCLGWLQNAQAVNPPPDGGYPAGNTAEGQNALLNLTSGGFNAAIGWLSPSDVSTGSFNTAVGAG